MTVATRRGSVAGSRNLERVNSSRRLVAVLVLAALVTAGCSKRVVKVITTSTSTQVVTATQTLTSPPAAGSTYTPPPAKAVTPLGSAKAAMPAGEREGTCPYIANIDFAQTEGDRVFRTAVLTTTTPAGCRFYFWSAPFQAIGDIVPMTFATPTDAYNAMVATGTAGAGTFGVKDVVPGVDAVLYQTAFNPQDGSKDWACTFAKGNVMVTVHTQQTNTSQDARNLAVLLAPKF